MKFLKQTAFLLALVLLLSVIILPASAAAVNASPTTSAVYIDGKEVRFQAYLINGNNYFRLRDVAYALSGTSKEFETTYDSINQQVILTSLTAYTPIGNEMTLSTLTGSVSATPTTQSIYLDGTKLSLTAYVINETNYIKLRDLAAAVDFGVTYIAETDSIDIDTSVGYTPVEPVITLPTDLSVTFIGDSIGVGVEPYLRKHLTNLYVDAKVSRQFSEAKTIVTQLLQSGKLSPTVVIELGSNGTIKESTMRELIELIGSDRKIVFVNVQVPRSWCAGDNATISKVCLDYTNTMIADWYGASLGNSSYFATDGVHPSKTGAAVLAKLIAEAVVNIQ